MTTKTRRQFSPEFKREAVELASQPGQTLAGAARDLGIRDNLLAKEGK
jgi:transposase